MPASIPYDHPSLVLGNIVHPAILDKLKKINALQAQTEAAQDKVNAYISMKRSLEMTIDELIDMNVDISVLVQKIQDIDNAIVDAATNYANTRLANETGMLELKEQIGDMEGDDNIESPVDFMRTDIKKMPLSSDSLKLDAQYFSYDGNNEENPLNTITSIENYIKASASGLGTKGSAAIASAASAQIRLQQKNHSISGTLVITASCTHKQARLLAPLVIDVDKGIACWNRLHAGNTINTADAAALSRQAEEEEDGDSIPILSGAAYGSSFVGMIHMLKAEATGNGPSLTEMAANLQERFTVGGWFEDASGGLGVNPSFSEDIKNLLSSQKISSHITLVVMGAVPSVKSNTVAMGVQTFADFDAGKLSAGLAALSNATAAEKNTVDQSAVAARTGAKMMAMQGATIQSVMMGLGKIDQHSNRMMDINSLMIAFEDYLQEVKKGESGVPVNFYVKYISKQQLVTQWLEKYYKSVAS
jgi:hypothetical protein